MSCTQPIKNENDLNKFRNYYISIENKPRNYALIEFGLNSALRISDILALHWDDVYVVPTHKYRNHLSIKEQKTGKENIIILNRYAQNALESYRQTLSEFDSTDYIFRSQKHPDQAISRCQAFRIIKKAAKACGLEQHISCHSLRKTFGYFAWKQGTPPALLMSIYNHSSYEITKRYLGIDQLEKDQVYLDIYH